MATIKDYFLTGTSHEFKVTQNTELTIRGDVKVPVQMYLDFAAGSILLSFYLEATSDPLQLCLDLIESNAIPAVLGVTGGFAIESGFPRVNPISASDLKFCGRINIFSENHLTSEEQATLFNAAKMKGILLEYHDPSWAEQRASIEKPLAFISHDSKDKNLIAKPLVSELIRYPGCTIWYDEYSLKVGDSLRESIEKGLKECRKCVLILTKNFLSNTGWTKAEFNSVFTREIIEQTNVILPVWVDVSREDVYAYSPSLANKVAAKWDLGAKEVAHQLYISAQQS